MREKLKENKQLIIDFIDGKEYEFDWDDDNWLPVDTLIGLGVCIECKYKIREKKQELKTIIDCYGYLASKGTDCEKLSVEKEHIEKVKLFLEFQVIADALHKREYGDIKRFSSQGCEYTWYSNDGLLCTHELYYPLNVYFATQELAKEAREIFGEEKFLRYMKP